MILLGADRDVARLSNPTPPLSSRLFAIAAVQPLTAATAGRTV
jgi:hypothetical protein